MMYYDVTCYQILSNESVIIQYNENCEVYIIAMICVMFTI